MKKFALLFALVLCEFSSLGQSTLTLEDAVLKGRKYYPQGLIMPQWVPGTDAYSHLIDGYQTMAIIDAKSGEESGRITAGQINDGLAAAKQDVKLRGTWMLEWQDDHTVRFSEGGTLYSYDTSTKEVTAHFTMAEGNANVHLSTNGNAAYTVGNNVLVSWNEDGSTVQVTKHENPNIVSGQAIARSEFGISEGLFWSPKGDAIAFYEKDESAVTSYPLLDITSTPGSLNEIKYPMAGQGSEYAKVGVYRHNAKKPLYLDTDGMEHDQYLTNLSWSPDGKTILLAIVNRTQNHYDVVAFNTKNGKRGETLLSVSNDKWAEPEYPAYWVNNKEFVWMTERDGYMNLYLYNTKGELVRQLTDNDFVATGILGQDKSGDLLFTATGVDPRESHLFSVSLKGKQIQLTKAAGYHSPIVQEGGQYFIDSYSSVDVPSKDVLMTAGGKEERT
ncbi:MAG TPA: S9 family peptidase, partial [Cryomorphaceae bacterium]|nr:S9 family peptidase [Cryomorphaceae bacterium]